MLEVPGQRFGWRAHRGSHAEVAVIEACRVGQKVRERDRLGEVATDAEGGQVGVDVGVEVERALLDELHDSGCRHKLRDRGDAEAGDVGIDGRPRAQVGVAIAGLVRDLAILDDDDGSSGNLPSRDKRAEDPIHIARNVRRRWRAGGLRSRCIIGRRRG